jgi:hypothetical protein
MGCYEHCFVFIVGVQSYLVISRVAVEEAEKNATSRGVHDLVDARKGERIFRAMLVEIGVIDTHP